MLAAIIAIFAVIADQITKYLVVANFELYEVKPFIPYVMSLKYTQNRGAAFSMLSNHRWVFMILSTVAMGLMIYVLVKEYRRHPLLNISLAMVLGGGIGNMIDRVRLEYVVDFFRFDFVDFAIFNVADCFITVGAVLMMVYIIFFEPKVEKRIQAELAEKQKNENGQNLQTDTPEGENNNG